MDVPVLERTTESESLHTRCLLSLVWALHEVAELLSIIFVKHIAILTDFAEREETLILLTNPFHHQIVI